MLNHGEQHDFQLRLHQELLLTERDRPYPLGSSQRSPNSLQMDLDPGRERDTKGMKEAGARKKQMERRGRRGKGRGKEKGKREGKETIHTCLLYTFVGSPLRVLHVWPGFV